MDSSLTSHTSFALKLAVLPSHAVHQNQQNWDCKHTVKYAQQWMDRVFEFGTRPQWLKILVETSEVRVHSDAEGNILVNNDLDEKGVVPDLYLENPSGSYLYLLFLSLPVLQELIQIAILIGIAWNL